MNTEMGIVITNTRISTGEMDSIMTSEPSTVMRLVKICTMSFESEALIVSTS